MNEFTISSNKYLSKNIRAFYHINYVRMGNPGNPDYLNVLKNTYNKEHSAKLNKASENLRNVLKEDLPKLLLELKLKMLTVCVVPRAKSESAYEADQLLFKSTVRSVISGLIGFEDGTDYIVRYKNTRTTHFYKDIPNYDNDGSSPYPGISRDTCHIAPCVKGKNILLIDDIYTKNVNIDEDAIQALFVHGASNVFFYSVGKTNELFG
ncbi:amidophosphoribosyltransferase [Geovibrio thiophilus]|uniref:Amidophosphoribosyltransferase n=1 Tax=Geovibrio thiophilus TaxID=139438 RepID=A0A3R5UZS8_9BACT|nr:amidophosphoribosyltransferase [Geovibrio thiophilus]QAR32265.1 amidophosphoribosyltransferase [Geovibrio thiophilus]